MWCVVGAVWMALFTHAMDRLAAHPSTWPLSGITPTLPRYCWTVALRLLSWPWYVAGWGSGVPGYPNVCTQDGYTPLHFAAEEDCTDIVTILVDRGAAVDAVTIVCGYLFSPLPPAHPRMALPHSTLLPSTLTPTLLAG